MTIWMKLYNFAKSLRDIVLHTLLGLVIALVLLTVGQVSPILGGVIGTSLILFFRELTQVQSKYYNNDFRKGWLTVIFRDTHKVFEWLIPSILIGIVFWFTGAVIIDLLQEPIANLLN